MACVAPVGVAWHPALPSSPPNLIYWGRKVGWRTGISPTRSGPEGSSRNEFRPGRSVRPSTLVAGLFADGPCSDPVTSELGRQIGRAHVCTPVTNAHLVCRLLLEKQKKNYINH